MQNDNLFSHVYRSIKDPDAPLMTSLDGSVSTYNDLVEQTGAIAHTLTSLGVKKGDRVGAQIEKSVEAIWLYLACMRVGAVFLPLNTSYTVTELAYFINDATPHVFVCDPNRLDDISPIARNAGTEHIETLHNDGTGSLIEKSSAQKTEFEDVVCADDDLAAILYTSGTTGRAKGAMLTHANLRINNEILASYWNFTSKDVLLHALPIYHTHGLFVATNVVLFSGASMLFHPTFDRDEVIEALPHATALMGVPTFYARLLTSDHLDKALVQNMRLFVSGSAPLSPEVHKAFYEKTGLAILERYGMTETNMNTSNPYDGARKPGTVGKPLPGIDVIIADPNTGQPLPDGEIGSIEIRGPNVFKGYWQMPEKTKQDFRDNGFFISGDLGFVDSDGYINISGRSKDLIISGGFNVYPAEVENAIDAIDGISESAVIGAPHPDFGEGVTAVVVPSKEKKPSPDEIRTALSDVLAAYKVPKRFFYLDELPRNKMGKVQKTILREEFKTAYDAA